MEGIGCEGVRVGALDMGLKSAPLLVEAFDGDDEVVVYPSEGGEEEDGVLELLGLALELSSGKYRSFGTMSSGSLVGFLFFFSLPKLGSR